jgi:hypothetical protein
MSEIIEIKMNWKSSLNMMLVLFRDGDVQGKRTAQEEFSKMAKVADLAVNARELLLRVLAQEGIDPELKADIEKLTGPLKA